MSKGSKTFSFKTESGEIIKIQRKTQEDAIKRLAELVTSVLRKPQKLLGHVKRYQLKSK